MSSPIEKDKNWMELNYQRQQNLVIKLGTYVLRCILDRFIPAKQLQSALQTCQTKSKIISDCARKILNQQQIDQLYPLNGIPNPEDFDITLLTYILRNHCGPHLNPKSPWWSIKDNSLTPKANTDIVADIVRLRNLRNKLNHTANASLDKNEFETDSSLAEEVLLRLAAQCGINDMKEKIENVILESQTPELKRLREDTARFLQDQDGDSFVETKAFDEAHRLLEKNNVVVLEGDRGEGKSTMAERLALKTAEAKHCLKLTYPSDWHHVDMTLDLFKIIIIDGILDWSWDDILSWKNVLSEISSAVQKKQIKVIITSWYDTKKYFGDIPMFQNTDGNNPVVQLKSTDLLEEEQIAIFQAQAKRHGRQVPHQLVMECVQTYHDHFDMLSSFGFPECVSIFLTDDDIYNKGSVLFKSPEMHIDSYFTTMFSKNIERFLPLAVIASKEDKVLSYDEIKKAKTTTDHVERVASLFGRKVDDDFLEKLKQSLDSLIVRGFLKYDERTGQYSFSHSIIGDIVRQVLAKKIAEQANQISPSDSQMEHGGLGEHQTYNFKKGKIEMCC